MKLLNGKIWRANDDTTVLDYDSLVICHYDSKCK